MSTINKYEAIGIFVSVGIMAVALSILRFQTDTFVKVTPDPVGSQATVIVGSNVDSRSSSAIEDAIKNGVTADGKLINLIIDDVKVGSGKAVVVGDTVVANYVGTTRDGVQFDSSYVRGVPFEFTIGAGKVIQGWEKGLIGMKVGGQRILVIPSDMAYGNKQVGLIPANSPLVFSIELLEIK
jgi:peptidylprolyl isomerase